MGDSITAAMSGDPQSSENVGFVVPKREILNEFKLVNWVHSKAYADYMEFLHELSNAVKGLKTTEDVLIDSRLMGMVGLFETMKKWMAEYPPEDMGAQRYGNKAYRKWYERLQEEAPGLVADLLPDGKKGAVPEIVPYLMDSFGNQTRIDYGSGHEASFMIFVLCLYKLGVLTQVDHKFTVLRLFALYIRFCRELQTKYRMEPAGSRGVHAIDDYQFLPFLFGSSQLIGNKRLGVDSYTKKETCEDYASVSLFFDAVNFIFQTKTGPFHEHSNQLWNISAVVSWEKVNGGMFKMYDAEVLRKFPVVQHFLFGSLFSFEKRPDAPSESLVREVE